jgi:hypothetical protein
MFAIGSDKVMEIYAGAHEATDALFDRGVIFQPEILLHNHLAEHGVPVEVMDFDMTILRN